MLVSLNDKFTAALAWVYNWITVLTGIVVSFISVIPNLLNMLPMVDITPLVGAERAAQIMAGVALLKAVIEVYRTKKAT